jgi:hypothetical protein
LSNQGAQAVIYLICPENAPNIKAKRFDLDAFYIWGYFISLVIGFIKLLVSISISNSQKASNFSKIGLHFSPWQGKFVFYRTSLRSYIFFGIWLIALAPLFSWLSVVSAIYTYISHKVNETEPSDELKKLQFQIANSNLSESQMNEITKKIAILLGAEEEEKIEEGKPNDSLEIRDAWNEPEYLEYTEEYLGNVSRYRIKPEARVIERYFHTDNYDYISNEIIEYKIEGRKVIIRTIESSSDEYTEITNYIKDNVVIESEIRNRYKDNSYTTVEKELQEQKALTEWHTSENLKLDLFVLQFHPEMISNFDLRKFAREELERLKSGKAQSEEALAKLNCYLVDDVNFTEFTFKDKNDRTFDPQLKELFEGGLKTKFNITRSELQNYPHVTKFLNQILESKSPLKSYKFTVIDNK